MKQSHISDSFDIFTDLNWLLPSDKNDFYFIDMHKMVLTAGGKTDAALSGTSSFSISEYSFSHFHSGS